MKKKITHSVSIQAPPEMVWTILLDKKSAAIWYQEFKSDISIHTDWKLNSTVLFTDSPGDGVMGRVIVRKEYQELCLEYEGISVAGRVDTESEQALLVKGFRERYILEDTGDATLLAIEVDIDESKFETFNNIWNAVLSRIRDLVEVYYANKNRPIVHR